VNKELKRKMKKKKNAWETPTQLRGKVGG